jgi:hypothetical protein
MEGDEPGEIDEAAELARLRKMAADLLEKIAEWRASAGREADGSRWKLPLLSCAQEAEEIVIAASGGEPPARPPLPAAWPGWKGGRPVWASGPGGGSSL